MERRWGCGFQFRPNSFGDLKVGNEMWNRNSKSTESEPNPKPKPEAKGQRRSSPRARASYPHPWQDCVSCQGFLSVCLCVWPHDKKPQVMSFSLHCLGMPLPSSPHHIFLLLCDFCLVPGPLAGHQLVIARISLQFIGTDWLRWWTVWVNREGGVLHLGGEKCVEYINMIVKTTRDILETWLATNGNYTAN